MDNLQKRKSEDQMNNPQERKSEDQICVFLEEANQLYADISGNLCVISPDYDKMFLKVNCFFDSFSELLNSLSEESIERNGTQLNKIFEQMEQIVRLFSETSAEQRNIVNKKLQHTFIPDKLFGEKDDPGSPLQKRIDLWNTYYDNTTILKNISRKTPAQLLDGMSKDDEQAYVRYFGVTDEEIEEASTVAEAIWLRQSSHPGYLAYLYDWDELEQLFRFSELPNIICDWLPDSAIIEKAIFLGMLDVTIEKVNRKSYLTLRQTKEMKSILGYYTDKQWTGFCDAALKTKTQCMTLLNLYGVMELDAFCDKFREYYGKITDADEIRRCVYLGGRARNEWITGAFGDGREVICLKGLETAELFREDDENFLENLNYRRFTAKERKHAARDGWSVYPAWQQYRDLLRKEYQISEEELKNWLYEQYKYTLYGDGPDVMWENLEQEFEVDTLVLRVSLWRILLDIYLTTGLPIYKGNSRKDYAGLRNIPLTQVCGVFSFSDSGETEPGSSMQMDSRLYEFSEELQLEIFEIDTMPYGQNKAIKMRKYCEETGIDNAEMEWMLMMDQLGVGDYKSAEEHLCRLKIQRPTDGSVDLYLNYVRQQLDRERNNSIHEKTRDATVNGTATPVRRMQPKVGRNDPCPCGSGKKYKKCCGR